MNIKYDGPFVYIKRTFYEILVIKGVHSIEDPRQGNIDVQIRYKNGETYLATFFTLDNIKEVMTWDKSNGDDSRGLYFWCPDMIIVESLTLNNIIQTIDNMYSQGDLKLALPCIIPE